MPGTGKTTLAKAFVARATRAFVVDPVGDFNLPQVTLSDLLDSPELLSGPDTKLALLLEEEDPQGAAQEIQAALALAQAAGDLLLVLDEVGDYRSFAETVLGKIARKGRHAGIVSVWVSQFATDIPKTVRRAATRVYSFAQVHPDDIAALEECYGEDFAAKVKAWESGDAPVLWRLPAWKNRHKSEKKQCSARSRGTFRGCETT
jgi:hypothetical protein